MADRDRRLDEKEYGGEFNVAPPTMPPSPAGANADVGGEAAASRRHVALPPDLARKPQNRPGEPTPGREPFLGYDGMDRDSVLDWIEQADPQPEQLHAILDYERSHRDRESILGQCRDRLRRFGETPPS